MSRFRGVRVASWVTLAGLLAAAGCGGSGTPDKPAAPPFQGARIVAAAVGDPAVMSTVAAQLGEWKASRGASCVVLDAPVEPARTGGAHVLVFRGDRLGDLVDAGALAVLPESVVQPPARRQADGGGDEDRDRDEAPRRSIAGDDDPSASDPLRFSDVIPAYRDQVSKYGSDRVALPYGGSALVLVYNREALERGAKGSPPPEPPKTWADLDALARRLHGVDWSGDGKPDAGIALALGPDPEGVGDATFLARAAALGQHRDHYSLLFDSDTMEPRAASPPFVKALEGLVALRAFGPEGAGRYDAAAARKAFRDGKVALLIDRAEQAGSWGGGGGAVKSIGVAPLPGSAEVYEPARKVWEDASPPNRPSYLPHGGGWLVAVAASATGREREAAIDFVKYLVSPETSNRVRADRDFPMLPVRSSQVGQGLLDPRSAPGVEPKPWSDAVGKTLVAPRVVPGLRIPQADGYLADLAKGRAAAADGQPAGAALKAVDAAWAARTKELGAARQLWHYRRSLNSLVTTPQPPPKR